METSFEDIYFSIYLLCYIKYGRVEYYILLESDSAQLYERLLQSFRCKCPLSLSPPPLAEIHSLYNHM